MWIKFMFLDTNPKWGPMVYRFLAGMSFAAQLTLGLPLFPRPYTGLEWGKEQGSPVTSAIISTGFEQRTPPIRRPLGDRHLWRESHGRSSIGEVEDPSSSYDQRQSPMSSNFISWSPGASMFPDPPIGAPLSHRPIPTFHAGEELEYRSASVASGFELDGDPVHKRFQKFQEKAVPTIGSPLGRQLGWLEESLPSYITCAEDRGPTYAQRESVPTTNAFMDWSSSDPILLDATVKAQYAPRSLSAIGWGEKQKIKQPDLDPMRAQIEPMCQGFSLFEDTNHHGNSFEKAPQSIGHHLEVPEGRQLNSALFSLGGMENPSNIYSQRELTTSNYMTWSSCNSISPDASMRASAPFFESGHNNRPELNSENTIGLQNLDGTPNYQFSSNENLSFDQGQLISRSSFWDRCGPVGPQEIEMLKTPRFHHPSAVLHGPFTQPKQTTSPVINLCDHPNPPMSNQFITPQYQIQNFEPLAVNHYMAWKNVNVPGDEILIQNGSPFLDSTPSTTHRGDKVPGIYKSSMKSSGVSFEMKPSSWQELNVSQQKSTQQSLIEDRVSGPNPMSNKVLFSDFGMGSSDEGALIDSTRFPGTISHDSLSFVPGEFPVDDEIKFTNGNMEMLNNAYGNFGTQIFQEGEGINPYHKQHHNFQDPQYSNIETIEYTRRHSSHPSLTQASGAILKQGYCTRSPFFSDSENLTQGSMGMPTTQIAEPRKTKFRQFSKSLKDFYKNNSALTSHANQEAKAQENDLKHQYQVIDSLDDIQNSGPLGSSSGTLHIPRTVSQDSPFIMHAHSQFNNEINIHDKIHEPQQIDFHDGMQSLVPPGASNGAVEIQHTVLQDITQKKLPANDEINFPYGTFESIHQPYGNFSPYYSPRVEEITPDNQKSKSFDLLHFSNEEQIELSNKGVLTTPIPQDSAPFLNQCNPVVSPHGSEAEGENTRILNPPLLQRVGPQKSKFRKFSKSLRDLYKNKPSLDTKNNINSQMLQNERFSEHPEYLTDQPIEISGPMSEFIPKSSGDVLNKFDSRLDSPIEKNVRDLDSDDLLVSNNNPYLERNYCILNDSLSDKIAIRTEKNFKEPSVSIPNKSKSKSDLVKQNDEVEIHQIPSNDEFDGLTGKNNNNLTDQDNFVINDIRNDEPQENFEHYSKVVLSSSSGTPILKSGSTTKNGSGEFSKSSNSQSLSNSSVRNPEFIPTEQKKDYEKYSKNTFSAFHSMINSKSSENSKEMNSDDILLQNPRQHPETSYMIYEPNFERKRQRNSKESHGDKIISEAHVEDSKNSPDTKRLRTSQTSGNCERNFSPVNQAESMSITTNASGNNDEVQADTISRKTDETSKSSSHSKSSNSISLPEVSSSSESKPNTQNYANIIKLPPVGSLQRKQKYSKDTLSFFHSLIKPMKVKECSDDESEIKLIDSQRSRIDTVKSPCIKSGDFPWNKDFQPQNSKME